MFWRIRVRAIALVFVLAAARPVPARELSWRAVDVRAHLDEAGALHVVERQTMLFSGDWNGGERIFRIGPGQKLSFESITRIAPDGSQVRLSEGDLSAVDRYAWKDAHTLRWRSRLPSDPSFDHTEIVYELAYTLSGTLLARGDGYLLDHDFLFPDRTGPVEKFTLELSLDPAWRPVRNLPSSYSRADLKPGEGFVLRVPLSYAGTGRPAGARRVAGAALRGTLLAGLFAAAVALWLRWRSREKALGRFAALAPADAIDGRWLEANLFNLSPEEAGALWDDKIGAPEVTAVLARLSAEKKIATETDGKKLSMCLLVPRSSLHGYEDELLSALFFGNRTETDTDAIRQHYRSSGFDPASKIKTGLEQKLARHPDFQDASARPSPWPAPVLFLCGIAALVLSVLLGGESPGAAIGRGIAYLVLWGIGSACAYAVGRRSDRSEAAAIGFLWLPVLIVLLALWGYRSPEPASPYLVVSVFLMRLGVLFGVFRLAATRDGPKRIARRKTLASARAFFARELSRPEPRLQDAWFPWIVAFGLSGQADHWFRAHGGARAAGAMGSSSPSSSSSSGSSSGSSSSWTGGGGTFGGAGASATWAAAASGLAAGVSAPSSSGGGGGSGGSSGGGGGGGW